MTFFRIFTARRYANAVYARRVSVRLSVWHKRWCQVWRQGYPGKGNGKGKRSIAAQNIASMSYGITECYL